MNPKNVLLCMGTRPEIIKMAPVYFELRSRGLQPLLLHSGQHHDMADPMYAFFNIVPDFSLNLRRASDSLADLSATLLEKLHAAINVIKPDAVLVHGDTSSAAMAALTAFYHKIPVGHVEAGLRSHQEYDPFPEEKNRELIGRLARWHFAPTDQARRNLLAEGIADNRIHMVGNTIVDTTRLASGELSARLDQADELVHGELKTLFPDDHQRRLVLVTAHRRENLGRPLISIAEAVRELLETDPDIVVVWPVHSNPRVRTTVDEVFGRKSPSAGKRLFLTKPLSYPATLYLLKQAWLVLTDSGGIQEEGACLNAPVLVLRETTERPELISAGGGLLIGTAREKIVAEVCRLRDDARAYEAMRAARNPFGDGYAARRICDVILGTSGHGV